MKQANGAALFLSARLTGAPCISRLSCQIRFAKMDEREKEREKEFLLKRWKCAMGENVYARSLLCRIVDYTNAFKVRRRFVSFQN